MYQVTLHYEGAQLAYGEHERITEAADLALQRMPAMFMAVADEISLRVAKDGRPVGEMPLEQHLEVITA